MLKNLLLPVLDVEAQVGSQTLILMLSLPAVSVKVKVLLL